MGKKKKRQQRRRSDRAFKRGRRKVCYFCTEKIDHVDYKDVALLRRYVSDRAKIRSRRVTGNCEQHQHKVATAVKNAREMALLPYVGRG
ncbi:MAG: 30S ribosomal protein S18 [Acidimicrobiia bacterium]